MKVAVFYIAGDIGGTNSRLKLLLVDNSHGSKIVFEKKYPSQQYENFGNVLESFLSESKSVRGNVLPVVACLAVAGPVRDNCVVITNVAWTIRASDLTKLTGIKHITLINDFGGVGYGLTSLGTEHLLSLNPKVQRTPLGPIACLGAGTGLGEVYCTASSRANASSSSQSPVLYDVFGSEGGHCEFAPCSEDEYALVKFIRSNLNIQHVSVERVVSGGGLPFVYQFLAEKYKSGFHIKQTSFKGRGLSYTCDDDLASLGFSSHFLQTVFAKRDDKKHRDCSGVEGGMYIGKYGTEDYERMHHHHQHTPHHPHPFSREDILCVLSLRFFVRCYARECGNLMLKFLPSGGCFIAGGIASKIMPLLRDNRLFYDHVIDKGRLSAAVQSCPLYIVKHPNVGMLGAKVMACRMLAEHGFNSPEFVEPGARNHSFKIKSKL